MELYRFYSPPGGFLNFHQFLARELTAVRALTPGSLEVMKFFLKAAAPEVPRVAASILADAGGVHAIGPVAWLAARRDETCEEALRALAALLNRHLAAAREDDLRAMARLGDLNLPHPPVRSVPIWTVAHKELARRKGGRSASV